MTITFNKKRLFIIILIHVFLLTYIYCYFTNQTVQSKRRDLPDYSKLEHLRKDETFCHYQLFEESLVDISEVEISSERRSIFFLETSCNSWKAGKIVINARQACAVESAARLNPNSDLYLLYASPGLFRVENTESDRFLQVLKSYPNVKILHFDVQNFIKNTPVEKLWTSGTIKESRFPMVHTSDIFRLLILWKYGGMYLDLDVIVIKSLESLPVNFAGAQAPNILANGVMGFEKYREGHHFVEMCLEDLVQDFKGDNWSYNGPRLITRIVERLCPSYDIESLILNGKCKNFHIFPPSSFYLIPWQKWWWLLDTDLVNLISSHAKKMSYLIHFWNKLSFNTTISIKDVNVPYLSLATEYCPGVAAEIDEYF